jgi:hypothetical protein
MHEDGSVWADVLDTRTLDHPDMDPVIANFVRERMRDTPSRHSARGVMDLTNGRKYF